MLIFSTLAKIQFSYDIPALTGVRGLINKMLSDDLLKECKTSRLKFTEFYRFDLAGLENDTKD
jgi:hypothetical protein